MKLALTAICLLFCSLGWSQETEKPFSVSLEYSPIFSSLTNSRFLLGDRGFMLGNSAFVKTEYRLLRNISFVLGAGIMDTREFSFLDADGFEGIEWIESRRLHTFGLITAGLKYKWKSIFVLPEIGYGKVLNRRAKQTSYVMNSVLETKHSLNEDFWNYNDDFVPLFLTIGTEVPIGNMRLMMAAKGFYSVSKFKEGLFPVQHSYGFGIMTGVKF